MKLAEGLFALASFIISGARSMPVIIHDDSSDKRCLVMLPGPKATSGTWQGYPFISEHKNSKDLDLSLRADDRDKLKILDIGTIDDLVQLEVEELPKLRVNKNSLSELEELVAEKGLSFGMYVSAYNLDEDQISL